MAASPAGLALDEQRVLESTFQQAVQDPAEIERAGRRYRQIADLLEARLARWEELARRTGA